MLEVIGLVIIWGGVFFCVVGVVGLIRMPDVYCRLHAAGKVATVGLCGLLVGAAFLMPSITLKMVALAVFAVLTLPVSTHAIAAAAYRHGVPMEESIRDDLKEQLESAKNLKLNEESSAS